MGPFPYVYASLESLFQTDFCPSYRMLKNWWRGTLIKILLGLDNSFNPINSKNTGNLMKFGDFKHVR